MAPPNQFHPSKPKEATTDRQSDETFYGYTDKYHAARRMHLLRDHPELRQLFLIDPSFKFVAAAVAITHLFIAYCLRDSSIGYVVTFAMLVGTLYNCALENSLHETIHNLAIKDSPFLNKVFGNCINFALGWPSVGGYYRTHRNHHAYLGTDLDAKYPNLEESEQYDYSIWGRLQFVLLHPLTFGARWARNVNETPTQFMTLNFWSVWAFDAVFWYATGWRSMLYLLLSFWSNDCFFIQGSKNFADHRVEESGEAVTSSNYGYFNLINFNIGFHREHHDLPNIPGRYLAMVPKIAPEHYSDERYIAKSLFGAVTKMLLAPPGQGLRLHAHKTQKKDI